MLRRTLLLCGVLSSLLYIGVDILASLLYGDYHSFTSQAISELGAVGAPTRQLVAPLFLIYGALLTAFGAGVWASSDGRRALRLIGALLVGIAVVGWLTPPMHLRGTSDLSGDAPHIIFTGLIVLFILSAVALGSSLHGRRFRQYSIGTLLTIVVSGALTAVAAGKLAAGQPTPWLGIAERINIGAYLLWVGALAIMLLRSEAAARGQSYDQRVRHSPLTPAGT